MRVFLYLARGAGLLTMLLLIAAGGFGFVQPAAAACGFDGVEIAGTEEEAEVACEALEGVVGYFAELGFSLDPEVSITFKEEVFLDLDEGEDFRVSACFIARRHLVEISSWTSTAQAERQPWGVEWGRDIVASIARHELVHVALHEILGDRYDRLGTAWHEFVAYAVQFELMGPGLRDRIMRNYKELTLFASPDHVNLYVYGADPDAFGVRSYLFAGLSGGRDFIADVLRGRVDFDTRDLQQLLCR